jgi:hypothetical protein
LPRPPFPDEVGDRRRSTLLYFYMGVVFSFLAIVLTEKLPSSHYAQSLLSGVMHGTICRLWRR